MRKFISTGWHQLWGRMSSREKTFWKIMFTISIGVQVAPIIYGWTH